MSPSGTSAPGRAARDAIADELQQADPHAPTLCEGWDVAHLAAHLVLRDSRPEVMVADMVGVAGLSRWATRQLDATAARPYPQLVELVRRGPRLSPTRLPAIDDAVNAVEMAVHREDVRRGAPGWSREGPPVVLDPVVTAALGRSLSTTGRLAARSVPGPLEALLIDLPPDPEQGEAPGAADAAGTGGGAPAADGGRRVRLRSGSGEPVVVSGAVLEVVLFLFGRDAAARVELSGRPNRVAAVRSARRGN